MKTENSEATSGNEETRGHYQAQLIFLGSCPMGLNSLSSRGWFQLTCCEYPKWVTAVNSMSAICCPLGHFWTAAGLQSQLLTGNMAGLTQFQKGERTGRGRERRREKTHMLLSKKDWQLCFFFPPLIMVEMHFEVRILNAAYHILCFVFYYFTHEVGLGVLNWNNSLMWKLAACKMSLHSHLFRHIHHLIFQTQKWIFPLL